MTSEDVKNGLIVPDQFLVLHASQLDSSGVPQHFWPTLCKKIHHDLIFDAGDVFTMMDVEDGDITGRHVIVSKEGGISAEDPTHIYLIDHAWTFRDKDAINQLREMPPLLDRMAALVGASVDAYDSKELVEQVYKRLWLYSQTYTMTTGNPQEPSIPVWYVMDEFGSSIRHSDNPKFRAVPFIYIPDQTTYTLLFPIKDTAEMEEVTRDVIEGPFNDSVSRRALLLPWRPDTSFRDVNFDHVEPGEDYFLDGHIRESLPLINEEIKIDPNKIFKVFSEYHIVNQYLNHPQFEIVENEEEADILWLINHFKDYETLSKSPHRFVNQFPFENVITIKDLLNIIVCRGKKSSFDKISLEPDPKWMPAAYNLKTELDKFVSYYQNRQDKFIDNHWIVKPWNLARGLDIHITNNLDQILRLPFSGPKIAQKYIEDPVLFDRPDIGGVKFDIRYIILVRNVRPLKAYIHKKFYLRFANEPFELKDFNVYQKHFTVMNYQSAGPLCKMLSEDFIEEFEKQFHNYRWATIERDIVTMFREVLENATAAEPPRGIASSPQSRALYAADIMLAWDRNEKIVNIQPQLLEINWMPDCQRACEYYPNFYNDIFQLLFLDKINEELFLQL